MKFLSAVAFILLGITICNAEPRKIGIEVTFVDRSYFGFAGHDQLQPPKVPLKTPEEMRAVDLEEGLRVSIYSERKSENVRRVSLKEAVEILQKVDAPDNPVEVGMVAEVPLNTYMTLLEVMAKNHRLRLSVLVDKDFQKQLSPRVLDYLAVGEKTKM